MKNKAEGKVIISSAVTGAIHTPSMSPHLPVTPEEIISDSLAAAEAGAAILHLHARHPDGRPDQSPEGFAAFLPRIKQGTDAVINITTGGSPYMSVEERAGPAATFQPELASLNMGSMNFGLYPMLNRYKDFKHDWEREHLEGSKDLVFRNSFKDIEYVLETCYGNGTRFEFECYDTSHLYNLAHFADRGLVKAPFFVQSVFGLLGGIGGHHEDVLLCCQTNSNQSQFCGKDTNLCGKKLPPFSKSDGAVQFEIVAGVDVTFEVEVVVDGGVDGDEFLQTSLPTKSQHRTLSSSKRKVRVFRSVV